MLQESPLNIYLDVDSIFHVLTGFCNTLKWIIKKASENIEAASGIFGRFWEDFDIFLDGLENIIGFWSYLRVLGIIFQDFDSFL